MSDTINDDDWARIQRGAADAAGGLIKTDEQKKKTDTWARQRDNAQKN